MIIAVDVLYYDDGHATAAGIGFLSWDSSEPCAETVVDVNGVADYIPGQFYRRELPCVRAVIERFTSLPDCIIIDGYVYLGPHNNPGLGLHLWNELKRKIPVIGVAKNRFRNTPSETEVFRGRSRRPLYITAVGIPLEEAKRCVAIMKGPHRIPDLLRLVDRLTRKGLRSEPPLQFSLPHGVAPVS